MSDKEIYQRFVEEVLMSGPEATLPCNLSVLWLTALQQSTDRCLENFATKRPEDDDSLSLPLAAILHILCAKAGSAEFQVPMEELFNNFEYLRIELAIEELRRKTDYLNEPATLASIFTDRELRFSPSAPN